MIGPGLDLVNTVDANGYCDKAIRWDEFNNSPARTETDEHNDDEYDHVMWSVEDRNRMLVDLSRADIYQSKKGEAVLIPGSCWDSYCKSSTTSATKPVVHKSPEILGSDQCRVLFTQDILFE